MSEQNIVITGCGVVSPYGLGTENFRTGVEQQLVPRVKVKLDEPAASLAATSHSLVADFDLRPLLGRKGIRNLDRLTRLTCCAGELLQKEIGFSDPVERRHVYQDESVSIVLGTSGGLQSILDFDLATIDEPALVQPGLFPNTVFNAAASFTAIRLGIKASCITLSNGQTSALDALSLATSQVSTGRSSLAIAGGAEEFCAARVMAYANQNEKELPCYGEGAVLFALEREASAAERGATAHASIKMSASAMLHEGIKIKDLLVRLMDNPNFSASEITNVYSPARYHRVLAELLPNARFENLLPVLGDMNAATGAFELAHTIYNRDLDAGSHVLFVDVDKSGYFSVLTVEKLRSC